METHLLSHSDLESKLLLDISLLQHRLDYHLSELAPNLVTSPTMPPSTRRLERNTRPTETPQNVTSTTLTKPFPFLELPDTVRQRFYELQFQSPRGFVRLFSK